MKLVRQAMEEGASLRSACRECGISVRTFHRWKGGGHDTDVICEDRRTTANRLAPPNKLTAEERHEVLAILNSAEFASSTPAEVVPALADRGRYLCSESTMYRILKEENMLKHRGRSATPERKEPPMHSADAPNKLWSWDITYLKGPITGMFYYLYMIIDVFSRKIVGWEVWPEESGEHASELISRAVCAESRLSTSPLVLHSDNGSPMKAATMLATLYKLGITPSNSRPHVSNDNAYSEAAFKTLKYRPSYKASGFSSLEDARLWCRNFVSWYNDEHHHSGIKFFTPSQRHSGEVHRLIVTRNEAYAEAKRRHPSRWNGRNTRNWELSGTVWLNSGLSLLGHTRLPKSA